MYKKIMLSLLLLPYMVVSNSDKDYQIEQLKNAQRNKEEQIALIIEQIDTKESIIDALFLKAKNILPNINCDEIDIIQDKMDLFAFNLQQRVIQEKSIAFILNYDFTSDNNNNKFELKRIKYLVIRYALEYINLYKLLEQYEQHLQELFDIHYQLKKLQN